MNSWYRLGDYVIKSLKGITPKYTDESNIIVLNQKCIRNNKIDYSYSRFHDGNKEFSKSKILKKGDLLFNSTGQGTAGRCAFVRELPDDKIVITDSHILILRLNDYYLAECFSYCFYKEEGFVQSLMEGSTGQGELDKIRLFNIEFKLPNKDIRKKIANFFNKIDEKIEVNTQINAKLEAMAKTLYEYWFIQFDFPYVTSSGVEKPYKSSGGKMVYNEELKREIPEGWEAVKIKDFIKTDKSGDWGKAEKHKNYVKKVNCIRGADLNGLNGQGTVNAPKRFILEKNQHKLLNSGDLIIEISGGSPTQSTGRLGMIIDETFERFDNDLICSNFCRAISLKDEKFVFNFVQMWSRLYDAGVLFGWEGKTSGIKNLLLENFISKYSVIKPNSELVENYHNKVRPFYSKIQKKLIENQKLAELRDWLLPMLMNGQVTVNQAKEYVSDVNDELGMVAEDGEK